MRTRVGIADDGAIVVVHRAGALVEGVQRCDRCGADLPLPAGEVGWERGALIRHEVTRIGETMTQVGENQRGDASFCTATP